MAATNESLHALHEKFAKNLTRVLERDEADDMPTDAATLGVIKAFLKDNEITADPADKDMTSELRQKFIEQQETARKRKLQLVESARQDIQQTG